MGACDFGLLINGESARDAYKKACDEAIDEQGHQDGYNGTISTTHGFKMVSLREGESEDEFVDRILESPQFSETRGNCACLDKGGGWYWFIGWAAE